MHYGRFGGRVITVELTDGWNPIGKRRVRVGNSARERERVCESGSWGGWESNKQAVITVLERGSG